MWKVVVFVGLYCAAVTQQGSAMTIGGVPSDQALQAVQESMQEAMQLATSSAGTVDLGSHLIPVLDMVDAMLNQTSHDNLGEIKKEATQREAEMKEQDELRAELASVRAVFEESDLRFRIAKDEENAALSQIEKHQDALSGASQELLDFDEECLAALPELQKRSTHTKNDLDLLADLARKLEQLASGNSTHEQSTQILAQIGVALASRDSPKNNKFIELLDLENGTTEEETDIQRMKRLLSKLREHLQNSFDLDESRISGIQTNCSNQKTDLRNLVTMSQAQISRNTQIAADRNKQALEIAVTVSEAKENSTLIESSMKIVEKEIEDRMGVSLHLIKSRQQVVLVLSQMKKLLEDYIAALSTTAMVGNTSTPAPPASSFVSKSSPKKQHLVEAEDFQDDQEDE